MNMNRGNEPTSEVVLTYELILDLERRGLVQRTFRRLEPERQLVVVRAILAEAAERGPSGVRIKEVARRAGVSVGSLYQYFGNRRNLLAFTGEVATHMVIDTLSRARREVAGRPIREALCTYLTRASAWHRQHPGLVEAFAQAAYHKPTEMTERVVKPVSLALLGLVEELLRQARLNGELRPEVDAGAAARLLHALLIDLVNTEVLPHLNAYYQLTGGGVDRQRVVEAFLSLISVWLTKPKDEPQPGDQQSPRESASGKGVPGCLP